MVTTKPLILMDGDSARKNRYITKRKKRTIIEVGTNRNSSDRAIFSEWNLYDFQEMTASEIKTGEMTRPIIDLSSGSNNPSSKKETPSSDQRMRWVIEISFRMGMRG